MGISDYVQDYGKTVPASYGDPWEATDKIKDIIRGIIRGLGSSFHISDDIAIHKDAVVEQQAVLKGPLIVGKGCFVGAGTYLRDGVFLGDDVVIGPHCEVKSSFIFGKTRVAHLNYVGDSIVGRDVNIEAGAVLANHGNERDGQEKTIKAVMDGKIIDTGVIKFGSIVGDGSRIGANAVLNPGTMLLPGSVVGRLEHVDQRGYQHEVREAYDRYAKKFDEKFGAHFRGAVKEEANIFLRNLQGKDVIDLGSGPGNHAEYFQRKGFQVLCVDFSEPMLQLCREKGLKTGRMDIEEWELPEQSADGIWAYACLLHVPKAKAAYAIENIYRTLRPGGIFGLAVKEGSGERFETHEDYPGTKRLFAYFHDEEIREMTRERFDLAHFSKTNIKNKYVFLNYVLRAKTERKI